MVNLAIPVVLVHGLDDTSKKFRRMRAFLSARGWQVYAPDLKPSNGDLPLEQLAQQLADYINDTLGPEAPFHLLGYSMGGLVTRYYLQRLGGLTRVRRYLTLSSPHNGTWAGYGRWNAGCKQMRPNSAFLKDLNRDIGRLEPTHMVSLWTPFDLIIIPATSSIVSIGENHSIPVLVHPGMVSDHRSLLQVADILANTPT
jgi:triacylglycerol lipase